ncbi:MAG: hypothetical protein HXX13_08625 [Bacteroidetes bacterium]|nr:hypothetical protein [Bacteroidota bacterium]
MTTRGLSFPFILLITCILLQLSSFAQEKQDTQKPLSILYPSYSLNIPAFDMKDRFGITQSLGAGYSIIFKNKWLLDFEGNFLFGGKIKNSASLLAPIATSNGYIIDQSGTFASIAISERGFTFWLKTGKLIPTGTRDPNSGILLMSGIGMMQHKIRIDVSQNTAPQLRTAYKKGYDHLCNGPAINEFVGYQYIDPLKRVNFYAGLDFSLAWTQSRRAYYFTEMTRPNEKRFDMLCGIKIGWLVPIYGKSSHEYFYY